MLQHLFQHLFHHLQPLHHAVAAHHAHAAAALLFELLLLLRGQQRARLVARLDAGDDGAGDDVAVIKLLYGGIYRGLECFRRADVVDCDLVRGLS